MVTWKEVAADFQPDGALRDIYLRPTCEGDWDRLLEFLRRRRFPLNFFVDGEEQPIPESASQVFRIRENACPLLQIRLGEATVACHFFTDEEMELDIEPGEWSKENWEELLAFLRDLSRTLGRPLFVAHENRPESRFLEFDPRDVEWRLVDVDAESRISAADRRRVSRNPSSGGHH